MNWMLEYSRFFYTPSPLCTWDVMPKICVQHRQNSALPSELGLDSSNNFSLMSRRSGNKLVNKVKQADAKTHTSLNKVPSHSLNSIHSLLLVLGTLFKDYSLLARMMHCVFVSRVSRTS